MFFIVTTGRSGSQSLARTLDQHPLCVCLHEPHRVFIKLAAERCHGQISDAELRAYLLPPSRLFPHRVGLKLYGEADQKLSFFIPLLADLGDTAKFIWLIRDGRDVVASSCSRGWYSDHETTGMRQIWDEHRIAGDRCGDVSPAHWSAMSPFEKCCWYWSYTNRRVACDLGRLSEQRWLMLRLEDFVQRTDEVLAFLDLPYYPLELANLNRSDNRLYSPESWSESEKAAFEFWCGDQMNEWYPDWRLERQLPLTTTTASGPKGSAGKITRAAWSHTVWLSSKALQRARLRAAGKG